MTPRSAGRPRSFDQEEALRHAAHLFWKHGYSGTTTRMLAQELGISGSSLYAAFGTKADLFDTAVRTYARRYSAIYARALRQPTTEGVISHLLRESAREFTRTEDGQPGCLTTSAVMSDASPTLDVRTFVADLQNTDEALLRRRLEGAWHELAPADAASSPDLSELVLTVWHGLSVRADLGASREQLLCAVDAALDLITGALPCDAHRDDGGRL
jgi:AcrR family transcriptional regulator